MTTATSERRDAASRRHSMRRNLAFFATLLSAALVTGCGHEAGAIALAERDGGAFGVDSPADRNAAPQPTAETSTTIASAQESLKPEPSPPAAPAAPAATGEPVAESTAATYPAPAALDAHWYAPLEADFRRVYERDAANAKLQTFNDYFAWVKTFYEGSIVAEGWKSRVAKLVDRIPSEESKASLRTSLNAFGRRVSSEWAKSGSVRRINTTDILEFGPRLEGAKERDDGSGAALQAELDFINKKIDERLK